MFKTLKIDPLNPQPALIDAAAEIVCNGGVVVYPTSGLYGVAADALNKEAVACVYAIKQRPDRKPLSVLVNDLAELQRIVRKIPPSAFAIMDRFWPGGITLVFEASENLPANLTANTGSIGVRQPKHPVAGALVKAVGRPVTATSANVSGETGCSAIETLDPELRERTDMILDAGFLAGGPGSTVVDVTTDPPVVLREGAVKRTDLASFLN